MTIGATGVVSARVANNTNVANKVVWTGFSVLTDDPAWAAADPSCGTEGYLTGEQSASSFDMYVKNTGWDANWNAYVDPPVATSDMPWGLTVTSNDIPVEAGRSYTISYNIKSTLSVMNQGFTVDEKYIQCKVFEKNTGDPAITLESASGCDKDGYMTLKKDQVKTVKATFTVDSDYTKGAIGIKFALGAFYVSYPEQVGLKGNVTVTDFKITANPQYSVKFKDGSKTLKTSWVNGNAKVASYNPTKKGYTFKGWYIEGTNTKYNFNTKVTKNTVLKAKWTKTKAPAKAKITKLKSSSSKKLTVTIKKIKDVNGYQIQYSTSKKFKGAKTKTAKKNTYTIKKLKSGVKYYVRVKAFKYDSKKNKVLSKKWSKVKSAYVR